MKFISLTPKLADSWMDVIHHSDDAWMFHVYDWLPFTEQVWNLESKSFLVEHEGVIVAVCPLQMHRQTKILKSTYMGSGGVAVRSDVSEGIRKKVFRVIYERIHEMAHEYGSPRLEIILPSLSPSVLTNIRHINPLVYYFYNDVSTHTWIVDLRHSQEDILKKFSQDARQKVKKAEHLGYKIRRLDSLEGIERYYSVHCETVQRTGVHPHPKEYFLGIWEHMCQKGHAVIWEAVDAEDNSAAFELIGLFGKGAMYWSGCCRTRHLDSGVNYLLQQHSMLWAKNHNVEWFDNGEAFPNVQDGKLRGLTVFKGKFGGDLYRLYKGSIFFPRLENDRGPLREWLRATRGLIYSVLGDNFTAFIEKILICVYRFMRDVYRYGRRLLFQIRFLKPCWTLADIWSGLFYNEHRQQDDVEILKSKFAEKLGIQGALVLTSSGRTALELGLKVLKEQYPQKTKVLISTYGCRGIFDPVLRAGLEPMLCDIDETLSLSVNALRETMGSSKNILAVVVPHLCGAISAIDQIASLAKEHQIAVIEDVCQALGAKVRDKFLGTQYDMAIFSFGMGKNVMATASGALVSNILMDQVVEASLKLKQEKMSCVRKRFLCVLREYFFKLSADWREELLSAYDYCSMHPLDARLISSQMDRLDKIIAKRQANAKQIIEVLRLCKLDCAINDSPGHIYTKLPLVFNTADGCVKFEKRFQQANIETESMYVPLHLRDCAVDFPMDKGLTAAEKIYKNILNVPVRPNLTKRQVRRILRVIKTPLSDEVERINQKKYERDYSVAQVSIDKNLDPDDLFAELVAIRLRLLKAYGMGKAVLDVGCGSGDYLFEMKDDIKKGVGIDYSRSAIDSARLKKDGEKAEHIIFICDNARNIPYENRTFDLVYSFSALAYIPNVGAVIEEMARVLSPGGMAILEFGNRFCLNTIVCRAYPQWAITCHVSTQEMKLILDRAGFKILDKKTFQILPYWGNRPNWIKLLLHPFWKRLFQKKIKGKMLDEWISSLPLFNRLAYRHIFICQKI
jgi:dTDP-4-amino-4,6-dideoxygalactose transaminase/ubiquinone/menaquinone biosynthesis C-methylase UbiE